MILDVIPERLLDVLSVWFSSFSSSAATPRVPTPRARAVNARCAGVARARPRRRTLLLVQLLADRGGHDLDPPDGVLHDLQGLVLLCVAPRPSHVPRARQRQRAEAAAGQRAR